MYMLKKFPRKYVPGRLVAGKENFQLVTFLYTPGANGQNVGIIFS